MLKRSKVSRSRDNPQWKEKKALLQAVVDEDVPRVVQLCDEGVPPDKRAVHAAPFPIEVAVALGNYELAEALFAKGAYPPKGTAELLGTLPEQEKKIMYDQYCEWSEFMKDLMSMVLSRAVDGEPGGGSQPAKLAYTSILGTGPGSRASQWTWEEELRWYRLLESYGAMNEERIVCQMTWRGLFKATGGAQGEDRELLTRHAKRVHFFLGKIPGAATADCISRVFKRAFENLDTTTLNMLLVHGFHYPVAAYRFYGFEFTDAVPPAADSDGQVLRVRGTVGPRDPLHTPEEAAEATAKHLERMASLRGHLFLHAVRRGIELAAPTDPPVNLGIPFVWHGGRQQLEHYIVWDPMNTAEVARKVRAAHDRAFLVYERMCKNQMSGPWGRYKQRFWMKSFTTFWWLKVSKLSIPPEKGGAMDMEAYSQSSMEIMKDLAKADAQAAEADAEAAEA